MFCHNCGVKLEDSAKFCNKCGTQIAEKKASNNSKVHNAQKFTNAETKTTEYSQEKSNNANMQNISGIILSIIGMGIALFLGVPIAFIGIFGYAGWRLGKELFS